MALRGQGSLHAQALTRLLLVGLLVAIAISLVSLNTYYAQRENEFSQKEQSIRQFYEKDLLNVEENWQADADHMKTRLEFSRILEDKDIMRWPKLNAYLNAQAEFTFFSNLVILNSKKQVLFSFGPEAHKIQNSVTLLTSSWYYAEDAQELYRVFNLPIWLGSEGQGTLLLMKTANNAAMKAMAIPEVNLYLYFQDRVQAASNSDNIKSVRPGLRETVTPSGLPLIQVDLPWPGSGKQPTLLVQRELHFSYPLKELLQRPLIAVLIITILIWLGMGRWLTNTVRRIENLNKATDDYGQFGNSELAIEKLKVIGGKSDEIADLSNSMEKLVQAVEDRNFEQKIYLETISMLEEAVLELNGEGVIVRASTGWCTLSRSENAIGKKLYEFIHHEDRGTLEAHFLKLSPDEHAHEALRLRLNVENESEPIWVECNFVCFHDRSGNSIGLRGVLRDITQTYLHEKQVTHMALHDALTGLPNRVLLEDRFNTSIFQSSRSLKKVGICFIDLDHFKDVNDTLGHKVGDQLLQGFTARILGQLRKGDTVARWGGDEFVVLLPGMNLEEDIRHVVKKIIDETRIPLKLETTDLVVTYSMGVAFFPDDGGDMETLFAAADRAMFVAKEQGRNQSCFFCDISTKSVDKKELFIQNRLANAINTQQIEAWFQPIISAETGRCASVEVLARWLDKEQGWVSPAEFIPMAESLGLINELGQQIMLHSLGALQRWHKAGKKISVAINVSKRQLFTPDFAARLKEEVARHGISACFVILEVTESVALQDVENAVDRLEEIKQLDFRIALDDFGTGYSSLSQLHEIKVDELKIDISFVRRLHEPSGLSMTQAIINLARALNMKTVAEGVETEEAANKLRELGVDYLQGYYFAKPMPADEFGLWLAKHNQ